MINYASKLVDTSSIIIIIGLFKLPVQLFSLLHLVVHYFMLSFQVIFVIEKAEVFWFDSFFCTWNIRWHECFNFLCFWQWNTVVSSVKNLLSCFWIQSQIVHFRWRKWSSFWFIMIKFLASSCTHEIVKRAFCCHFQTCSKWMCERLLLCLMTNISSVSIFSLVDVVVVGIWFVVGAQILIHHLVHLGFFILSQHWEMLLVQVHLWSIQFSLKLLILIIWIINLFIYFLFKSKIIPHVLSINFNFSMALTFSVKPLISVLHIFINTVFFRVLQTHF